jgi:hypothetical protein
MVRRSTALGVTLLLLAWSARAGAQDYFQQGGSEALTFKVDRERTMRQKVVIGSLFGGSVLFGGVGLLFHIDSKHKSDQVSTDAGHHTGQVYTQELDDTRHAAVRSRNIAIASYAVGGGLLIGTFIAYLLTDPGQETIRVGTEAAGGSGARLLVAPTERGALVGGSWRF